MVRLLEGKRYRFLVEKEVILPDNSIHFLMKGPDGKKYLVPVERYNDYGIMSGETIKCRVDRINCKGKVFLEPENPWYSEGRTYKFTVAETAVRTDSSGINHQVVVVADRAGNKIPVPYLTAEQFPSEGATIDLRVERISKGRLQLAVTSRAISDSALIQGRTYEFIIERIERGMDNQEYFVVIDPFGKHHTLSKKFYEYYGYRIGTKFKGKVIKYNDNGENTIEPFNPYFKVGTIVKMEVNGSAKNVINKLFTITLVDKYGFLHYLETDSLPQGDIVRCRIITIKKGKPVLELL